MISLNPLPLRLSESVLNPSNKEDKKEPIFIRTQK